MDEKILTTNDKLMKAYVDKHKGTLIKLINGAKNEIDSYLIQKFKRIYPDVDIRDIKSLFWEGYNEALNKIVKEDNIQAFDRGYNLACLEMGGMCDDEYNIDEDKVPLDIDEINAEFERLAMDDRERRDYYADDIYDYKTGFDDGYSEGYDKGYYRGLNDSDSHYNSKSSNEDYDEGYKDGYEAGLEARPSDNSSFNGYYGADGGFHEYNNGWEGE